MAQRIPRPSSALASNNQAPGRPPDLGGQVDDARKAVLSILQDTDWPKEASNDVQDLIRKMEASPTLNKLPKEETETSEQLKTTIHQLLGQLESAHTRLKGQSEKYGSTKKGLRKRVKRLFSRNDPSQCASVVRSCRNAIVEGSTTLNVLLASLEAESKQRASRAAGEDSTGPQDTDATPTASGSNPHVNAQSDLTTTSVPPISSTNESAAQSDQVTSSKTGKQGGSSARGDWLNGANKAFKLAEGVSGALPVVGSYVGAVAKVGLTVVEMVQTMEGNEETAERLGKHVCRLSGVLERVRKQSQGSENTQTIDGMNELQKELRLVQDQIKELKAQRGMKKVLSSNDNAGSLKKLQQQVQAALEEVQLLANLNVSILVNELHNDSVRNEQQRLLDRLGDGKYGAQGNLVGDVTCLPGTRVEILERIDEWIRKTESAERVLWIRGMAGRGKSTIASTVAVNWERRAACAIFHFRRGQNKVDTRLVCSLARQLGKSVDPELRSAILSSVRENQDIADQRLDEQFNALFVTPLSVVKEKSFPVIIIVDALDECDPIDYAVDFVKLIELKLPLLPDNVKFLLTTRPEAPLLRTLEPRKWYAESLDSMDDVDADIRRFMCHALAKVKIEHEIVGEWPVAADISQLVEMSQGLFQWARTVVKYVNNGSPTDQLAELLKSPTVWSGVDELYTQILSKALERVKQDSAKRTLMLEVLGTLVAAPYPVSLEIVAFLHEDYQLVKGKPPETVPNFLRQSILSDLTSLLFVPQSPSEPIRLMHTSIRDLLVDHERCEGRPYWVNLAQNHQRLATACMRQMNRHLKENICDLKDISKPRSKTQDIVALEVSKGVQYCCRSWSIHLTKGQHAPGLGIDGQLALGLDFKLFSEEKILFWLELMSLIECFNEATVMAKQVHQWLLQLLDEAYEPNYFVTLWNDVHRFAAAFSAPIAFSPLHIYVSAFGHCPVKTELWKRYSNHAKVRTIRGVQPPNWPCQLWARVVVKSSVNSVAFSPDGAVLALGCNDKTIHLLDPHTGGELREPLIGHSDNVLSVCFSPDGKLLASGSSDHTVRLWDPLTGSQVGEPLTGHSSAVWSVCFSPDSKLLTSGSSNNTIQLWDPQTGSQVGEPLAGHSDDVMSVCFSPDGKRLASGSSDHTIRLWDPLTGSQVGEPLTGHSARVLSVCFSPNGKRLASASEDKTIRLWDPQTGSQVGNPLTGHSGLVWSVCFSPDGELLASGSFDNTIQLWDPQTSSQVGGPLTGHSEDVRSVCFSPDGKLLVSGSSDHTIRLWDPQAGSQAGEPLTAHSGTIWSVCFSPDGKLLASGSYDKTIRLWDPQSGSQVGEPLTGHSGPVNSVCFSPDGKLLASGSADKTVRLWDPQTGSQLGEPLTGHSSVVYSVCCSPDGKLLASGSSDRTIRLWDLQTGSQVAEPLTGHSSIVYSLCFSPDGNLLASGSFDSTIRLWNPQSGRQVGDPLTGHRGCATSIWFSPDGKTITGRDVSGRSMAWDTFTRQKCDIPPFIPRATTLHYEDHWVTFFSSSRLLWLPSQYWPPGLRVITVCEGKLAVAHDQTVSIFDISDALRSYNPLHL